MLEASSSRTYDGLLSSVPHQGGGCEAQNVAAICCGSVAAISVSRSLLGILLSTNDSLTIILPCTTREVQPPLYWLFLMCVHASEVLMSYGVNTINNCMMALFTYD